MRISLTPDWRQMKDSIRRFSIRLFLPCLILVCVIFRTAFSAESNGSLSGRVIDKATRDPLRDVNVVVLDFGVGNITDGDGYFLIQNIRAGTCRVQFSLIGYQTVIVDGVVIYPDRQARVDVALDGMAIQLQPVEIQSRRPLIERDQPSTIFSLGEKKLSQLPISSFREALFFQPGTTLEGNVRGGKIEEVQYFIDGLPVQDVVGGGLGMDLPRGAISGLTFYSGGFGVEYGNALSGIVNVATRMGDNKGRVEVLFEKDNWIPARWDKQVDQLNEIEVSASGPLVTDKIFYSTSNNYRLTNTRWWQDFQNFYDSPVDHSLTGSAKIDYLHTPTMRFSMQGIYSFRDWRDYEFSWRYNLPGLPRRGRDSYRVAFIASNTYSPVSSYTISASRYYQHTIIGDRPFGNMEILPYEYDFYLQYIINGRRLWWSDVVQTIYSLKAEFSSQVNTQHFFRAGAELHYHDISSEVIKYEPQVTYFGKPDEDAPLLNYSNSYRYFPRSGNVYVQDKIEFKRDGSTLTAGVRWEFLDPRAERPLVEYIPGKPDEYTQVVKGTTHATFKHQFSPRLAFSAPLGPVSMFFLNVGYYFQSPLFDYLYSGINPVQLRSGTKSVLTGNPDLEPERTVAWEIGYKLGLGEHMVGTVTYFQKMTHNQVDARTLIPFDSKSAGDYGFASYVNTAEANARGLEWVLSKESGGIFSGSLSYTFMVTEGTSSSVNQEINYAQWGFPIPSVTTPLSWDQRHTVKADIQMNLPWNIDANMIVLFNSARPYTYYPTRDGFTPADSTMPFIPNNARMENVVIVHLKISHAHIIREFLPCSVRIYADIRNLLNTKNIRWMDSSGRIGGELSDPGAYYDPRRVRIGAVLEF
jgi:outer membrane receptor for ferrienterochelin and colicin